MLSRMHGSAGKTPVEQKHACCAQDTEFKLEASGMKVASLHGEMSKMERQQVLAKFRAGGYRAMVCSSMAAVEFAPSSGDWLITVWKAHVGSLSLHAPRTALQRCRSCIRVNHNFGNAGTVARFRAGLVAGRKEILTPAMCHRRLSATWRRAAWTSRTAMPS